MTRRTTPLLPQPQLPILKKRGRPRAVPVELKDQADDIRAGRLMSAEERGDVDALIAGLIAGQELLLRGYKLPSIPTKTCINAATLEPEDPADYRRRVIDEYERHAARVQETRIKGALGRARSADEDWQDILEVHGEAIRRLAPTHSATSIAGKVAANCQRGRQNCLSKRTLRRRVGAMQKFLTLPDHAKCKLSGRI